jgi:hypothetical protein
MMCDGYSRDTSVECRSVISSVQLLISRVLLLDNSLYYISSTTTNIVYNVSNATDAPAHNSEREHDYKHPRLAVMHT